MGEGDQVREDQTGVKRGITVPQSLLLRADREETPFVMTRTALWSNRSSPAGIAICNIRSRPVGVRLLRVRRAIAGRAPQVACAPRLGASFASQREQRSRSELRPHSREGSMSFSTWCGAVACAVVMCPAPAARAQDWPNRSMLAVSTVSAGNAADTIARIVLDQVSKQIGQSFVIENRTGAGGTIGSASAAKADPDGYTILLLTSSQGSAAALYKTLPYDPPPDFVPVALIGVQPSVLVAAPAKGWTSVADLVAAAKANPGVLNFASAGLGSASHWAAERLKLAASINLQHIPFRGPVEAFTEVMTG